MNQVRVSGYRVYEWVVAHDFWHFVIAETDRGRKLACSKLLTAAPEDRVTVSTDHIYPWPTGLTLQKLVLADRWAMCPGCVRALIERARMEAT